MKKDLPYISFARALAILLVVNSHATGFYPDAVANIVGRGGAIGNTLFFFVSGFTLYFSAENTRRSKLGGGALAFAASFENLAGYLDFLRNFGFVRSRKYSMV